jgi:beta-N-acetylhexosaminidase
MDIPSICGSLVIGGFPGTSLPPPFARALRERRRGGAILFRTNVDGGPAQVAALTRDIRAAGGESPLVGVDQEGGRVARLGPPILRVPSMRTVASWGDEALAERIAHVVGAELGALGFTIDFAPVLDVNTCAENPVIGDRAFGDSAVVCARYGVAWIRGLQSAGVLACGKHFPGHGDTATDSHVDLPRVEQPADRIESVELVPFRAAAAAGVAALMTAHVVYPAIDPDRPATLSKAICTGLRASVGFEGMLVSDDLEMKAIAERWSIEDAAVQAVAAGCDALLICSAEDPQERAVEALVRETERSSAFLARCRQAYRRTMAARRRATAKALDARDVETTLKGPAALGVEEEIARRVGS